MKNLFNLLLAIVSFTIFNISATDSYALLGLKQTASLKDVRRVCRIFKSKYHPDKANNLDDKVKRDCKQKFEEYGHACADLEQQFIDNIKQQTTDTNSQPSEPEFIELADKFVVYLDELYVIHDILRGLSHTPGCQSTEAHRLRKDSTSEQELRNNQMKELEKKFLIIATEIAQHMGASAIAPKYNYHWVDPEHDITERACQELNRQYREHQAQEAVKDLGCTCICQ